MNQYYPASMLGMSNSRIYETDILVQCPTCLIFLNLDFHLANGNFWIPEHTMYMPEFIREFNQRCPDSNIIFSFEQNDRRGENYLDNIKALWEIGK